MPRPFRARLGIAGYARMMASIRDYPGTVTQIAATADTGLDTAYKLVAAFHSLGLLHISSWFESTPNVWVAVYSWGPGPEAPPPTYRMTRTGEIRQVKVNKPRVVPQEARSFARFVRTLGTPVTLGDVMEITGLAATSARAGLNAMVDCGLAHVCMWEPRRNLLGGPWMRNYVLGPGRNVPRPSRNGMRKATEALDLERRRGRSTSLLMQELLAGSRLPPTKRPTPAKALQPEQEIA